jgi:hypothetical protein
MRRGGVVGAGGCITAASRASRREYAFELFASGVGFLLRFGFCGAFGVKAIY